MPTIITPPIPFDEVYRLYADRVHRFCRSQLGAEETAEDLTADVFLAAHRSYERVRPDPATVHVWLFRIARNLAIDRSRRQKRFLGLLPRLAQSGGETVEDTVEVRDELRRALDVLRQLSPRDRSIVGLRVAGDLSFAEIGVILKISEHAASMACRRSLKRVREAVTAEGGEA